MFADAASAVCRGVELALRSPAAWRKKLLCLVGEFKVVACEQHGLLLKLLSAVWLSLPQFVGLAPGCFCLAHCMVSAQCTWHRQDDNQSPCFGAVLQPVECVCAAMC